MRLSVHLYLTICLLLSPPASDYSFFPIYSVCLSHLFLLFLLRIYPCGVRVGNDGTSTGLLNLLGPLALVSSVGRTQRLLNLLGPLALVNSVCGKEILLNLLGPLALVKSVGRT